MPIHLSDLPHHNPNLSQRTPRSPSQRRVTKPCNHRSNRKTRHRRRRCSRNPSIITNPLHPPIPNPNQPPPSHINPNRRPNSPSRRSYLATSTPYTVTKLHHSKSFDRGDPNENGGLERTPGGFTKQL
ncbi:hypothetical protein TWF173_010032 [Orbilia oligospora]|nr:hypothetical protein TWF173_010032 [Orbilia oligospora]